MHKIQNIINLLLKIKDLLIVVSVVFMGVVGLVFAYKLEPLVQADRQADYRISATESKVIILERDARELKEAVGAIKNDTSYIRGVLSEKQN